MLGDAILYAARRAASTAVENVSRKAGWIAGGSAFLLCGLISALILAYQVAEPKVGAVNAVGIISAACLLIGLICLSLPGIMERAERQRAETSSSISPVATAVATVDAEARQAVDYFGALRVVGAAFVFGLGAARRLKS